MNPSPTQKPLSALIVDDEPLARDVIRVYAERHPELVIIGECAHGLDALAVILEQQPSIVFLDVQMPDMSGFAMLEELQRLRPVTLPTIVFVTAFDHYALQAFDANAVDYLLKPFDRERFARAVNKAMSNVLTNILSNAVSNSASARLLADGTSQRQSEEAAYPPNIRAVLAEYDRANAAPAQTGQTFVTKLLIKESKRLFFLSTNDVDFIEAADDYVNVHAGKRAYLLSETLSELERRLSPEMFVRIHRSTIVNVEKIHELRPHINGEFVLVLHGGARLKVSRSYKDHFKRLLGT